MKYENFEKAQNIISEIRTRETFLSRLNSPSLQVKLVTHGTTIIADMDPEDLEHADSYEVLEFLQNIRKKRLSEIEGLKQQLLAL